MKVSIIGSGNMAQGIASRFVAGGHDVEVHSRDIARASAVMPEGVRVVESGSLLADIFIMTGHYGDEAKAIAETYGAQVSGKVMVDITNPLDFPTMTYIAADDSSGAHDVAALFAGVRIVKAFNTVFADVLQKGSVNGAPIDVFVASDDVEAKSAVTELVNTSGMRALDAGGLEMARVLEHIELAHLKLQGQIDGNFSTALQIVAA